MYITMNISGWYEHIKSNICMFKIIFLFVLFFYLPSIQVVPWISQSSEIALHFLSYSTEVLGLGSDDTSPVSLDNKYPTARL